MAVASEEEKLALLRAHPDLAGRAAIAKELTAESTEEQVTPRLYHSSRLPGVPASFGRTAEPFPLRTVI